MKEQFESEKEQKQKFIEYEFFLLSWHAAVQHNKVWTIKSDMERKEFKKKMFEFLTKEIMPMYEKQVSDEEHYKNIERLQKVSEENKNKLNIGTCQKLLNMMCKYYWCVGCIPEPPQLPIDSINLKNAKIKGVNWTSIEKLDEYKNLIADFRSIANPKNLSVWELEHWNRRSFK